MFYRIFSQGDHKNHDIESDPLELPDHLERLHGVLGPSAETRELFERRCAQDPTGKGDSY
jgi:hypothetical protein